MLLRRVIGDVLRARRQGQHRTLREVSTSANVSLGYLSEIERGQKEASSELLAAICEALGSQLSDVLRDASDSLALSEHPAPLSERTAAPLSERTASLSDGALVEPGGALVEPGGAESRPAETGAVPQPAEVQAHTVSDGKVSVCVRRNGPLRTTLHAVRNRRPGPTRAVELTRPAG